MQPSSHPSKRSPLRGPRLGPWAALGLLCAFAPGGLRAEEPVARAPRSEEGPSAAPILAALESLESGHDAKCHSTASRFEDFLYGTPLGDGARSENAEAQKRGVRRLWSGASRRAAAEGAASVRPEHLDPEIAELFAVERAEDGAVRVALPGAAPQSIEQAERAGSRRGAESIELDPVRVRQYGAISYPLPAIP